LATLVSAIEVGSVRSVIPVCMELFSRNYSILIEKRGYFRKDTPKDLKCCLVDILNDESDIIKFIKDNYIKVVLFSVNVHDPRPLQIARVAQSLGITTIHLLDYWNGYRSRMELDGQKMFKPTKYFVPDEYAKSEAEKELIHTHIIEVVGQPSFFDLESSYQQISKRNDPFDNMRDIHLNIILFVMEPVEYDQGYSVVNNKNYRGYTESNVIEILIEALKSLEKTFWVVVLPHPRQDLNKLKKQWQVSGGDQYGAVYGSQRGRNLLPFVDGVVGMASTLLYEAWLVGKKVLSIQPGLRTHSLRMLSHKEGVTFIDQYKNARKKIREWLLDLKLLPKQQMKSELMLHSNSVKNITNKITLLDDNQKVV